jgi:SAM-dependent methyltransferase
MWGAAVRRPTLVRRCRRARRSARRVPERSGLTRRDRVRRRASASGLVSVAAQRLNPSGLPPSTPGRPRAADALLADGLALPYRPGVADGALCIAVAHHLASPNRRLRLLRQLLRVLRPGGRALVTVWAVEQVGARREPWAAEARAHAAVVGL